MLFVSTSFTLFFFSCLITLYSFLFPEDIFSSSFISLKAVNIVVSYCQRLQYLKALWVLSLCQLFSFFSYFYSLCLIFLYAWLSLLCYGHCYWVNTCKHNFLYRINLPSSREFAFAFAWCLGMLPVWGLLWANFKYLYFPDQLKWCETTWKKTKQNCVKAKFLLIFSFPENSTFWNLDSLKRGYFFLDFLLI